MNSAEESCTNMPHRGGLDAHVQALSAPMAAHAVPVLGSAFEQVTQESNTVPGQDVETQLKNWPMLFVCATHPFPEAPAKPRDCSDCAECMTSMRLPLRGILCCNNWNACKRVLRRCGDRKML